MSKLQIIQHSLGLDQCGRGEMYRNRFVSGPGHSDQPEIDQLVAEGLMEDCSSRVHPSLLGEGARLFCVTDAGIEWVKANSPKVPRRTKAQERYRRFLEWGDCFDSFVDFCRWDAQPERSWNGGATC
jgi:predicted secreted acid phosphatase